MIFWLGLVGALALLALVSLFKKPSPEEAEPALKLEEPVAGPPKAVVPSLIVEDDLEITMITAFPQKSGGSNKPKPSATAGEPAKPAYHVPNLARNKAWDEDDGDSSRGPKVEVIYEKDAEIEEVTAPVARILITAQGDSDRGKRRPDNQDSLLVYEEKSVFVVADGMGGYEGGQLASSTAVETIRDAFARENFDGQTESEAVVPRRGRELACAIQMANQAVFEKAKSDPALSQMGTTILAARFSPNKQRVYIGHVGDSRCYRLRDGTLRQLTTDHTMKALGMKGPRSNDLSRAVGIGAKVTIDLVVDKPRNGDLYLLCSDGLSKMVPDEKVQTILLGEKDLNIAVYGLIEAANDAGGRDNVTAVVIKVVDRGAPTQASA
ncbi:MAG TPA: protein phosphatase 2C domain-containing protein [Polyangiaceae bacterium]|nr:protein phosphatase 2C domain-containing protein [Polyangiaceae bacterium]